MSNLRDWQPASVIRCLVYSKPGDGKTFGAGTFPRPNWLDFDKGIGTLMGRDFVAKHGKRQIEYSQFTERDTEKSGVVKSHNAFDDACKYFDSWMAAGKRDQFDTWVIDSGTTLSELALNKAMVLLGKKEFAATSNTHSQALATGLVFPKIQDYGSERSIVEQFVQMVLDSNKHVVLLCHEKEISNKEGTVTGIVPLLTGKGVQAVCLKFDEVWYLKPRRLASGMVRELMTETNGIYMAKSRSGVPNGTEWTYDAVVKAMTMQAPVSTLKEK